ncbi:DUF6541 family protein [Microbacterium sp.]|uniref:DUF6541 family protein n=1 Tax=Microbacterium sp. TaxID=51671 RepID=UPI003A8E9B91
MITWIEQVPALLLALALLVVPGAPVALCLRGVSGVVRLALAIAVSLAVIGAATSLAPLVGLSWGLIPVLVVAVVVWALAAALWLLGRNRPPVSGSTQLLHPGRRWRGEWITVLVATLGWMAIVAIGIGNPNNPSQLYDGLFHINAVEFIAKTGDASPLHMTMVVPHEATSFYPTLWHAFVSLVAPVSGSIVVATNIVTIAVIALIWPVALAALAAVALPARQGAAIWAPLVSFGFSVFPLGFLNWGVLYPNLLGTVLVPILIATVLLAFTRALSRPERALRVLTMLAAAGATALAHPSALLGALALLVPYLLWLAWTRSRRAGVLTRVLLVLCVLGGLFALVAVWRMANVTTNEWLPSQTMAQSFGEVAFLSPVGRSAGLLLGPLAAIGIWRLVKDRTWWILGSYAASVVLFLISAWFPILSVRSFFVGIWYDDTTRVGALIAIWGLPLAGLGASVVLDWLAGWWRAGNRRRVVAIIAIVAVAAVSHLSALRNDIRFMRSVSFQFSETSQGLSPDEVALFEEISSELPEGSLVIGDPLTGAGLLYAYTGRDVVFPHVTGSYGPDAATLASYLVLGSGEVCDAAARLGVTHALDFGDTVLFENHYTTYDGLHDLERSSILTEVDRIGDAVLYEITGCR